MPGRQLKGERRNVTKPAHHDEKRTTVADGSEVQSFYDKISRQIKRTVGREADNATVDNVTGNSQKSREKDTSSKSRV